MHISENPYIDNLLAKIDTLRLLCPSDIAHVLPLYIKAMNNNSVVNNISIAYIDNYDGKSFYKKYNKYIDMMYEMFLKNTVTEDDRRAIFKQVGRRVSSLPKHVAGMKNLYNIVISATTSYIKRKKLLEVRKNLCDKFKLAIKKYLYLTYKLGYNEPSMCAKTLIREHRIDKYIMSGEFPLLLLPFLPDIESELKKSYEHYTMTDAWEMLKGRYFNHKEQFHVLALEIKSVFIKNIYNFSDYIDNMYTEKFYNLMLKGNRNK